MSFFAVGTHRLLCCKSGELRRPEAHHDDWVFAPKTAQFTLRDHFKVAALDGFGLKDRAAAIGAAGAVLHYLTQHLRRDVAHLTRLGFYQCSDYLVLDAVTLRNLEILEPLHRDAPKPGSLYAAINRTVTPMGARRSPPGRGRGWVRVGSGLDSQWLR